MAELAHAIPAVDMINATSRLQLEAAETNAIMIVIKVRANKPNWGSYLRSQMIPQEDFNFITAYENAKSKEERDVVLTENDSNGQAARTIVNLIANVAKDQNVRYVLTLLDDMLQEDKSRVEILHTAARKQKRTVWSWFLGILQRQDNFIVNQMSSIIAKLACFGTTLMEGSELNYYFSFLKDQLRNTTVLIYFLYDEILILPHFLNSVGYILFILKVYFLMAFFQVIRIIMATFSNILKKVDEREIKREAALQMVQCKTLKTLELMDAKKYDDIELEEDIEFLSEQLHLSVQDLSSFDEYCSEVRIRRANMIRWIHQHLLIYINEAIPVK
uniref:MIF4G_like_2 domain-containing protein n=1 Tax=Heterorhabditis bacteriophora TaxID=37862 RepID=A0A1I7XVH1_HETBA